MSKQGQIAPHEGEETRLVRAGEKPLAVVEKRKDRAQYFELVSNCGSVAGKPGHGGLVVKRRKAFPAGYEAIVVRKGNEQLIEVYLAAVRMPESPLKHRILGHLFGYSPEDIEAFIANPPECDCDKCRDAQAA